MNYKKLIEKAGQNHVHINEPMQAHTSFQVGGPADVFIEPDNEALFADLVTICKDEKIPFYILGNGSNLLVKDGGFRGAVICTKGLKGIATDDTLLVAHAGDTLKEVAQAAQEAGLTGLEFASGIPGTLGGGIRMNAGAYDGEMKDVVESATVLDEDGRIVEIPAEELHFSYRHSLLQERPLWLVCAKIRLKQGDKAAIQAKMDDLNGRRADKQPLEYPSAGSTFRRPEGYFAGKLIQDSGFQGVKVGGAQVSEKHAGFVINAGGATAADILSLIHQIQEKIREQFGVDIHREVIVIGEDPDGAQSPNEGTAAETDKPLQTDRNNRTEQDPE
ncbi:MAG: UDP-N-acetylmuramate dehydrogenase [Eubacteriaceae bacterium]|jgi:UDP-N-acetylmuramate dehydrogenase